MTPTKFKTRVVKVERRSRALRSTIAVDPATGEKTVVVDREDLGWFILLEGSWEMLYWGHQEDPNAVVGQRVQVTIQAEGT